MTENNVTFQHAEYKAAAYRWTLINDVCDGQEAVKAKGQMYLPKPNQDDNSNENNKRYDRYKQRSTFHNITGRTVSVLTSYPFKRSPKIDVPPAIDYVSEDIDGAGVSLDQQAQKSLEAVLKIGRHAVLVDYPQTEAPASRADMDSGLVRAVSVGLDATQIINWRTERVGANHKLSLVVISESQDEPTPDGFGVDSVEQYRVLRLNQGIYTQELWRKSAETGEWVVYEPEFSVLDGSGKPWDEIPLVFIGSVNNDSMVDSSPSYDMAELNVAHYHNSADYEDSVFFTGQAQPWMSGLSEEWRNWLEEKGIYVGSRAPILLPEGGAFGIAQAQPNTMAKEAMDQKEAQMVALGARLIQPGSAVKTATQSQGEQENNHSVLSLATENVSNAYTKVLNWMLRFMNSDGEAVYELNNDFTDYGLDPQLITALSAMSNTGKLPDADLWRTMKRINLIDPDKPDEDIQEELDGQIDSPDLDAFPAI